MSAATPTPGLLPGRAAAHVLNKLTMNACAPVMTWQAIVGSRGRHTRRVNSFQTQPVLPPHRVAGNFPKRYLLPALGAFILACTPASAQMCAASGNIEKVLRERFGEVPIAVGITENGQAVVHVFSNPETGTASVVVTGTSNLSCIIAAARDFALIHRPEGEPM